MRAVMVGLGCGRRQRAGMLFGQTELAAKGGRLKLDQLLHMNMRAGCIRQFVLAIDGGCGGDPDAQQQHKECRPKSNPS